MWLGLPLNIAMTPLSGFSLIGMLLPIWSRRRLRCQAMACLTLISCVARETLSWIDSCPFHCFAFNAEKRPAAFTWPDEESLVEILWSVF